MGVLPARIVIGSQPGVNELNKLNGFHVDLSYLIEMSAGVKHVLSNNEQNKCF